MTYTEIKAALKSLQEQGYAIPALNSKKEVLEAALEQILDSLPDEIPETKEEVETVKLSIKPTVWESLEIFSGMESTGTQTVELVDSETGEEIEVTYSTGDQSVHQNTCKVCGETYLIKGVLGGLREMWHKNTCLTCAPPLNDDNSDEESPVAIKPEPPEEILEVAIDPIEEITFPADTLPLQIIPRTTETPKGWELISLEIKDDLKFVGTVILYTFSLLKFLAIRATPYIKKAANFALRVAVYGAVAFKIFILPKIMIRLYYLGIWGVSIALRVVHSRRWSIA